MIFSSAKRIKAYELSSRVRWTSSDSKDLYGVLGLTHTATQQDIRNAFLRKVTVLFFVSLS